MKHTDPPFVHLNVHTHYSIVDGLISIDQLLKTAHAMGMSSIAITDQNNLFALVKFYRAAQSYGIKPIVGSDLWLKNQESSKPGSPPHLLTFLCQNQTGYQNLNRLISRAYQEGQDSGYPQLSLDWLTPETTQGLLLLSGHSKGDIGSALLSNKLQQAEHRLQHWKTLLGDRFYLTLQRLGQPNEEQYQHRLLTLAEQHQVPVVATNAVRFLKTEDWDAHEARVCINKGYTLEEGEQHREYTPQQYLRTPEEMCTLFSDLPEVIENSIEIAKRCNFKLTLGTYFLPQFPLPKDTSLSHYFKQKADEGLKQLFVKQAIDSEAEQKCYQERLDMEVEVIDSMGFSAYFLIVADFIQWAKKEKIPIGPGRGSGPGSLVAYALGITHLDPIFNGLAFERFLNKFRVSMPDIDTDFCVNGRDKVINYVMEKYGRNSVAQIITYGTMSAKAVVRDVGRVLGYPYGFVDKLAKLIPFEPDITLRKALQKSPELNERFQNEEDVNRLIKLAIKLEGTPRNIGKHAGGLVIAPSHLTDFTPLYCEPNSKNLITQFDKDDIETIGLVKFDFLGLRTLTIIHNTLEQVNTKRQIKGEAVIEIDALPLDDKAAYDLLSSGMTTAVFQVESHGMKELIKRLQPNSFDGIVPLIALYRPGPLQSGMVEDYISRRHGQSPVSYLHPKLEPILKSTYGVILYQEQVMKIAQVLAGYSLDEADLLRRAMGKKKHQEMAEHRSIFIKRAAQEKISNQLAGSIFDLMEKFSGYGFNKSHSVAYALLTYQTAWLKAHYPSEFMAAVLSSDMDNTDKVIIFIEECRQMGIQIHPPNINQCQYHFSVNPDGSLSYGLGAIKGLGEAAISSIIEARSEGPFKDLIDFCQRADTFKVNRRTLEVLIFSGAFDCFHEARAKLYAALDSILSATEQNAKAQASGQSDLFAQLDETPLLTFKHFDDPVVEWTEDERLKYEKSVLGTYLSGHPINSIAEELQKMRVLPLNAIRPGPSLIAGYVVNIRTKITRKGQKIAFVTLDDGCTRLDLSLFSDVYQKYHAILEKDTPLIVKGEIAIDDFNGNYKMKAESIYTLDQARNLYAQQLCLNLSYKKLSSNFISILQSTLKPFLGGTCPIAIHYTGSTGKGQMLLDSHWRVNVNQDLMHALGKLCGDPRNVQIIY